MTTVKEKLIALAETEAERDLVAFWMREEPLAHQSRVRAWQEVERRLHRGRIRVSW